MSADDKMVGYLETPEGEEPIVHMKGGSVFDHIQRFPRLHREKVVGLVSAFALEASDAKIAALTAENATLREALSPFAVFADYMGRAPDDLVVTRGSWIAAQQVTAGDFRRARAALRQEGKP